jgi:hypothetical protein
MAKTILKYLKTVQLPAVKSLVAATKFKTGTHDGVKITWRGDNFKNHFLGINQYHTLAVKLRVHQLRQAAKDPAIIEALGGEGLVETTLAHLWAMLKQQGQGEDKDGGLLVNCNANIFYIRDVDNQLWAVGCRWRAGYGWDVEALPLAYPYAWRAGARVFSRDSDSQSLEIAKPQTLRYFDTLIPKIELAGSAVKKLLKHLGVQE